MTREQLSAVPKYIWATIPIIMAVIAVLPGGLGGCLHGARWIFGFPWPNVYRCGTFARGMWVWHPAGIVFNQVFWLIFLSAIAIVSSKVGEKYRVGRGLFFFGSLLVLTILYFVNYRPYAVLFAEYAF